MDLPLTGADVSAFMIIPSQASPIERGRAVYLKFGCGGCHGADGEGGVPNRNAKAHQQIPALTAANDVADVFLESFITEGIPDPAKLDPNGPKPPIYMPAFGDKISEGELTDLISYLRSLQPAPNKKP